MVNAMLRVGHYRRMLAHLLRVEWKYTYQSARREFTRSVAARKFAREMWVGVFDLPAREREERQSTESPFR